MNVVFIHGLWLHPSWWQPWRSAFPVLRSPANKGRAVALTEKQFAYGFGNALTWIGTHLS